MPNTIQEAKRYLDNAKEILREKARKEDGYYQDKKYVKLAGHAAYTGVLVALDALFDEKSRKRKDVDWYKERLAKIDRKMLNSFNGAYEILHLFMSYDGVLNAGVTVEGLKEAERIINWVETRTAVA